MGDSRFSISLELDGITKSCSFHLPADSSLAELRKEIQTRLLSDIGSYSFESLNDHSELSNPNAKAWPCLAIYDCTLSPPMDVTEKVNTFFETTGPNSITLLSLGWFPSARLVVLDSRNDSLRESVLSSNIHKDEDFEYNLPNGIVSGQVKTQGHASLLRPSQVIQVAQHRFDNVDNAADATSAVIISRSKPSRKRTEEERRSKLDAWLKRLDDSTTAKTSKVSSQVKKMLIKSRAEGNSNIRVEDRFYLDTCVMDESDGTEDNFMEPRVVHRFFGRSNNIGHIVSEAIKGYKIGNDKMAELLVLDKTDNGLEDVVYRRLPNTLPIYECERMGVIENFDRVVIRIFHRNMDGHSSLLNLPNHDMDERNDSSHTKQLSYLDSQEGASFHDDMTLEGSSDEQSRVHAKIKHAIELFESNNPKKKTSSDVSEKVKHMIMKGKAKGDKKCHEKDRIYLEVIHVKKNLDVSISNIFLSKFDQIKGLVNSVPNCDASSSNVSVLVAPDMHTGVGDLYNTLPPDMKWIDAEGAGLIRTFQRVILF